MTAPMKRAGFAQGIYQQSVTKKEALGTLRITQDGRKFRYSRAGGALAAGGICIGSSINAAHADEIILAAVAIGTRNLTLTVTAGTAIAENALADGLFIINDNTGEGHTYIIDGNSAISASETVIYVSLKDPIRVALDTTTEFTLAHNPFASCTQSATSEQIATGVAPIAVTSAYYCWLQTGGPIACLQDTTPAVGTNMVVSTATAGAVAAATSGIDIDLPIVGYQWGTAGVSGEWQPIFLTID